MDVLRRNNVNVSGDPEGRPAIFAHGFGCDQNLWCFVAPAFEADHRVVLFDHVGAGASDLFTSDKRGDLAAVRVPTLVQLAATGHCPNLSAPEETVDAIRAFV